MSLIDDFTGPSLDGAKWTSGAGFDAVNDLVDLSAGILQSVTGVPLSSEWGNLKFEFVFTADADYSSWYAYLAQDDSAYPIPASTRFRIHSNAAGTAYIRLEQSSGSYTGYSVVGYFTSTGNFNNGTNTPHTLKLTRNSSGDWECFLDGVQQGTAIAELYTYTPAAACRLTYSTASFSVRSVEVNTNGVAARNITSSVSEIGDIVNADFQPIVSMISNAVDVDIISASLNAIGPVSVSSSQLSSDTLSAIIQNVNTILGDTISGDIASSVFNIALSVNGSVVESEDINSYFIVPIRVTGANEDFDLINSLVTPIIRVTGDVTDNDLISSLFTGTLTSSVTSSQVAIDTCVALFSNVVGVTSVSQESDFVSGIVNPITSVFASLESIDYISSFIGSISIGNITANTTNSDSLLASILVRLQSTLSANNLELEEIINSDFKGVLSVSGNSNESDNVISSFLVPIMLNTSLVESGDVIFSSVRNGIAIDFDTVLLSLEPEAIFLSLSSETLFL